MNFVKFFVGDYFRDTGSLTLAEHGAYTQMLMHLYATERPLPAGKELYRLLRAESKAEREAIDKVVQRYFYAREDGLRNTRADTELEHAARVREANREVGKLGGRPKRAETESVSESVSEPETESVSESVSESVPNRNPSQSHSQKVLKTSHLTVASARPLAEPLALVRVDPVTRKPDKRPPDCPHLAVLALWAECLPAMPQHDPERWRGDRADHLRVRWRETAAAKGWDTADDGLAYFRRLFGYVAQSPFLTGRGGTTPGRRAFVIELEWLVNRANWDKVHEGKYHPEAAA